MIGPLTVYVLPEHMSSTLTTMALDDAGLPYEVVDLADDERAVDLVQGLGFTDLPVVTIGAASWSGFRPDKIQAVASAHAHAHAHAHARDTYQVPVDPMEDLGCDSCQ